MTVGHAPRVYRAINDVMKEMSLEGISKDRRNTQGAGYNFRGIDDVLNSLSSKLSKHSLCILPRVIERECIERQSKAGGALFYTTLKVEFDFVSSEDGSKHTVVTVGEAMDSSDKSSNKAMSAAMKYACIQTFCIPTEGDNDADAHTPEPEPKNKEQRKEQSKPVASEWTFPFGKNKGKKISDVSIDDLKSAVDWMKSKNDSKFNDLIYHISEYLKSKSNPQETFGPL